MPGMHLVRGRRAILEKQPMLAELCRRTGQTGRMDWLEYHLSSPTAVKKTPTLLLFGLNARSTPEDATADDLLGALLLFEYRIAGVGINVFATEDATGQRNLIAPPQLRARLVETACRGLVERGALAVLISFDPPERELTATELEPGSPRRPAIARRQRPVPLGLRLSDTLDQTLSYLGSSTRRNLRRYRRKLDAEFGAEFVPQVEMTEQQFLGINRGSTDPVPEAVARWRYDTILRFPATVFQGLRTREGGWLSLLGGRRDGSVVEIDWQMNLAGLPRYSLSTAMRAYVIEHEIERGTTSLVFCGGTPHSMRHSFFRVDAVDTIALGRSPLAWMLGRGARWILPRKNFLRDALVDPELVWEQQSLEPPADPGSV